MKRVTWIKTDVNCVLRGMFVRLFAAGEYPAVFSVVYIRILLFTGIPVSFKIPGSEHRKKHGICFSWKFSENLQGESTGRFFREKSTAGISSEKPQEELSGRNPQQESAGRILRERRKEKK